MRFRNPTVAVLAFAIPCTWALARELPHAPESDAALTQADVRVDAAERVEAVDPASSESPDPTAAPPRPLASPPPARPPLALLDDASHLELEAGDHQAPELLARWAEARGLTPVIDAQVRTIRLTTQACTLEGPALRDLLDAHDVVVVRQGDLLHAVHRRNLACRFGSPWALVDDAAPVDPDALVTRVVQVRHGGGNAIFATVRGLLTRDANRIGNLLYVAGSEQLVICDLARKVRDYEQAIRALDQPAVAPAAIDAE